jgi:parallel beta-helix repeat protein
MKKVTVITLSLLVLLLHLSFQTRGAQVSSSTIRVPQDYPTIQAAINAAPPNATILVSAKLYYENLVINKPLQLIGENKDTTIIEGAEDFAVELVNVSNVFIKGFTLKNVVSTTETPIHLLFSNSNQIVDCNAVSPSVWCGVWLDWSYNNKIIGNNITSDGDYGVYLFDSDNNTIADNIVTTHTGILFSTNCDYNRIIGNTITTNNKMALYLYTCNYNTFYHNSFLNITQPRAAFNYNSDNFWNNSFQEGNYWSSYNGAFNETTGVGLLPYVMDPYDRNDQDNYPLRSPYIPGDYNHDGAVNMTDVELVREAWQSRRGGIDYNPHADFNMDGIINIKDATLIGVNW